MPCLLLLTSITCRASLRKVPFCKQVGHLLLFSRKLWGVQGVGVPAARAANVVLNKSKCISYHHTTVYTMTLKQTSIQCLVSVSMPKYVQLDNNACTTHTALVHTPLMMLGLNNAVTTRKAGAYVKDTN